MKPSSISDLDRDFDPLIKLIQVMRDDPVINKKLLSILNLDSFQRRMVINNWLEQLRKQNAQGNLMHALSCLFDDTVAEKVLKIISH